MPRTDMKETPAPSVHDLIGRRRKGSQAEKEDALAGLLQLALTSEATDPEAARKYLAQYEGLKAAYNDGVWSLRAE